jgi:hypothetical protein
VAQLQALHNRHIAAVDLQNASQQLQAAGRKSVVQSVTEERGTAEGLLQLV